MAKHIEVKNLSVIFGKKQQIADALALIDQDMTANDIMQETGATVANRNVNFTINSDELFVIVGLSGSGKSTFIRTLNLLNRPTAGDIIIDGENLKDMSKERLRDFRRSEVSMVFQHFGLLSHRSVIENVCYPLEIQGIDKVTRIEKSMEAIKQVGLEGWHDHMPSQLSGGMKQRVGLARALVNNPELLLMDEPYSALDPLIRREMQNELLNLDDSFDRTIVFITHDMNEAFRLGDRIALMKDAEVVQIGTPKDFLDNPANDYVRDFIADVDRTRILKVRSIMRKTPYIAKPHLTPKDVLEALDQYNLDYCYVTNDKDLLLGYVEREKVAKSRAKDISKLVKVDETAIYRNLYLKDIWKNLQEAAYDVPVVDGKGRLRGVITNDDIIKALAD
ncbi:MAG: quaternary amine ABC transporter ATP-binding protein [Acholeplasmataceae bacterium]